MSTVQRPRIPRHAWACFVAGLVSVGLTVLFYLTSLDLLIGPSPDLLGTLTFVAIGMTILLAAWSLPAIERSRGHLRGERLAVWGMVLAIGGVAASAIVLPVCTLVSDAGVSLNTRDRLRQIGLAIQTHHHENHRLPPAAIRGPDGTPLLSWRVGILPYLGEDGKELYEQFKLDEPWDGPHNRTLLARMPPVYRLPFDGWTLPHMTFFQVFVGPGTAFERDGLRLNVDFPDGLSGTILVAEGAVPAP
jgi:hypothetical protein